MCRFSFLGLFLASGIAVVSLPHADVFTRGYTQQPLVREAVEGKGLPDFGNLCQTVVLWTCTTWWGGRDLEDLLIVQDRDILIYFLSLRVAVKWNEKTGVHLSLTKTEICLCL